MGLFHKKVSEEIRLAKYVHLLITSQVNPVEKILILFYDYSAHFSIKRTTDEHYVSLLHFQDVKFAIHLQKHLLVSFPDIPVEYYYFVPT